MKKLIIIAVILFAACSAFAQEIKSNPRGLAWDANTEIDLAGYKLYWGIESENYPNILDLPLSVLTEKDNPNYTIDYNIVTDGHYYYAVTAYDNAMNESGFSNEVNFIVDKSSPENVQNLRTVGGISIIINIGN